MLPELLPQAWLLLLEPPLPELWLQPWLLLLLEPPLPELWLQAWPLLLALPPRA